jgi:hypothetical protein
MERRIKWTAGGVFVLKEILDVDFKICNHARYSVFVIFCRGLKSVGEGGSSSAERALSMKERLRFRSLVILFPLHVQST